MPDQLESRAQAAEAFDRQQTEREAEALVEANFVSREEAREFSVPPIRFEVFEEKIPHMETFVNVAKDWLRMPYIFDRFGEDATARWTWRREQQEHFAKIHRDLFARAYKRVTKNNKLRSAVAHTPGMCVETFVMTLEEEPTSGEQKLINQIQAFWKDDYRDQLDDGDLSIPSKIELLHKIEDQLAAVLTMIADYTHSDDIPDYYKEHYNVAEFEQAAAK